ncbi:flagellar hook-length control protein FliK [Rhodobacteraceae bacterium XHP0102]|nr:flagellar hook-length control protein FliK [Rhodobacteraceae bacterium XHP0102]
MQELTPIFMLKPSPLEGRLPVPLSQAVTEEAGFWTEMFEQPEDGDDLSALADMAPIAGRPDGLAPIHLTAITPLEMMVAAAQQDVASVVDGDTIPSVEVLDGGQDGPVDHLLPGPNAPFFAPSVASDPMIISGPPVMQARGAPWPDAALGYGRSVAPSPPIWERSIATDQRPSDPKPTLALGFDPQTQSVRGSAPLSDEGHFGALPWQVQAAPLDTAAVARSWAEVPRTADPQSAATVPMPVKPAANSLPPMLGKNEQPPLSKVASVPVVAGDPSPMIGNPAGLVADGVRTTPPVVDTVPVPQDTVTPAPLMHNAPADIGPVIGAALGPRPLIEQSISDMAQDQKGPDHIRPEQLTPHDADIPRHDPSVQPVSAPGANATFTPTQIVNPAISYAEGVKVLTGADVDMIQTPDFGDGGLLVQTVAHGGSSPTPGTPTMLTAPASAALAQVTAAQQIASQIDRHIAALPINVQGTHVTEFTLNPPELGRVRMTLETLQNGALALTIVAERPEVADFMRRHSPALIQDFLREGLMQTSVKIEAGQTLGLVQGQSGGSASSHLPPPQGQSPHTSMTQMQMPWGDGQSHGQHPQQQRDREWPSPQNSDGGVRPTQPSETDQVQPRPATASSRALDLRL